MSAPGNIDKAATGQTRKATLPSLKVRDRRTTSPLAQTSAKEGNPANRACRRRQLNH
jgi:hypothetical protein